MVFNMFTSSHPLSHQRVACAQPPGPDWPSVPPGGLLNGPQAADDRELPSVGPANIEASQVSVR